MQTSGCSEKKENKGKLFAIEFCMASGNRSLTHDTDCMVRITLLTTAINTIYLAYFTQPHFIIILIT